MHNTVVSQYGSKAYVATNYYQSQTDRLTNSSSEVNLLLTLRWRHAYGRKYYAVVNRFQFGSSSYDSVYAYGPRCLASHFDASLCNFL